MHVFQPVHIEDSLELQMMFGNEKMMLITAARDGKVNTMTASWGGFGYIWDRYVVTIYVRESRYTREILDGAEGFSISFLNYQNYRREYKYLGTVSGRTEDKIAACRLGIDYDEDDDVPYIDEAGNVIICRKLLKLPITKESILVPEINESVYKDGDYHVIYIGEVTKVMVR